MKRCITSILKKFNLYCEICKKEITPKDIPICMTHGFNELQIIAFYRDILKDFNNENMCDNDKQFAY